MKLIVGLGNPGQPYQKTRHNLGFMVLDEFLKRNNFPDFKLSKKFKSKITEGILNQKKIILAEPQTFMNNSGQAVLALSHFYKIKPKDILIIQDEIDLSLGKIRLSENRSSAGHKGIQSIIEALGTKDFSRIRIGINNQKPDQLPTEKYVLQNFTADEKKIIAQAIEEAVKLILENFTQL